MTNNNGSQQYAAYREQRAPTHVGAGCPHFIFEGKRQKEVWEGSV